MNNSYFDIVKRLAEWSKKWSRETVLPESRRHEVTTELYAIEDAAIKAIEQKPESQDVTPDKPGYYWVSGVSCPTRPVLINEWHLKDRIFMNHPFETLRFRLCPCPFEEGEG